MEDGFWAQLVNHSTQIPLSRLKALEIVETTKSLGEGRYDDRPAFEWSVNLDGDGSILDAIDHVEYHLHPTFTPQSQVIRSRDNGFQLKQIGWGTFKIMLTIQLKDGQLLNPSLTSIF